MADVLDQMRVLFEPSRALVQAVLGSFDLDCIRLELRLDRDSFGMVMSHTMSIDPALHKRSPDR